MITTINRYSLNSRIEDYASGELIEFSDSSYRLYSDFGMHRIFKNEKYYWADDNILFGKKFTEAIVATVGNIIYKISFRRFEPDAKECTDFRVIVYNYLVKQMGDNHEIKEIDDTKLIIWSSDEGNVVLELAGYATAIILTSRIIRNAKRRSLFGFLFRGNN